MSLTHAPMVPSGGNAYFGAMRNLARWLVPPAAITVLALLTACGDRSLKANAPVIIKNPAAVPKLPELLPSVVDAPIAYDIGPVRAALEDAVPRKFGDINQRIKSTSNKRQEFAFEATRAPFKLELNGEELTLSTVVEYKGRGWYDPPIGPKVSGGCDDAALKPRIEVSVTSDLKLTSAWRFTPKTRIKSIKPPTETERDQCRVTFLSIDVTSKVIGALQDQLRTKLPSVDASLARFELRPKVRELVQPAQSQCEGQ